MERRTLLMAGVTGGLASAISLAAHAKEGPAASLANPEIDRTRAQFILSQAGLDGIILNRPENVFYATGHWPFMARIGVSNACFAIIPANKAVPIIYVSPQFPYYYVAGDVDLASGVVSHLVTGHEGNGAAGASFYPDAAGIVPPPRELRRRQMTQAAAPYFADIAAAIAAALAKAGITGGRIGYDSLEARQILAAVSGTAQGFAASDTVKTLRLIKTAFEIDLMKAASNANVAAARKTAANMRQLGTIKNVRNAFNAETSRLGNTPGFMAVNAAVDEAYDAEFVEGTSVLIDCVSSLRGYHGDYGRTIFIGEPRKEMADKVRVTGLAWNELRNQLKPGMRFSEIRSQGAAILRKMGYPLNVPFGPHCVGLAHTEQPLLDSKGAPIDTILEAGMIISVDCALMEVSPLGTAHLEDLTLITSDGHAPIHDNSNDFMIV